MPSLTKGPEIGRKRGDWRVFEGVGGGLGRGNLFEAEPGTSDPITRHEVGNRHGTTCHRMGKARRLAIWNIVIVRLSDNIQDGLGPQLHRFRHRRDRQSA